VASRDSETQATLHSRRQARAERSPSARAIALCAAAVAAALVPAADAQTPSAAAPDSLRPLLLAPGTYSGGAYRTSTGESVTVYTSHSYPSDRGQRWADFLASLVHGRELSSIKVFIAPLREVEQICGRDTYACYSRAESSLLAPGDDPGDGLSAEAIVMHEYGHHIAANRSNAPWNALAWGPKRWATAMRVCPRTRSGELWPGAWDPVRYDYNPGEGVAESYRLLNERKFGRAESPWQVVSDVLYPSEAALAALEQDVLSPWAGPTTSTQTARLTRATRTRTFTVPTELDGALKVTLRPSAGLRARAEVFAGPRRLAGGNAISTTVCGQRSLRIRVSRLAGSGSFGLTVEKP
jgi:hypothetical protein